MVWQWLDCVNPQQPGLTPLNACIRPRAALGISAHREPRNIGRPPSNHMLLHVGKYYQIGQTVFQIICMYQIKFIINNI